MGARGIVDLDVTIATDGRVRDVKVIKADHPLLADPAVQAVRRWIYKPTLVDGVAVENHTHVSIEFQPNRR
jgi:protein TonB